MVDDLPSGFPAASADAIQYLNEHELDGDPDIIKACRDKVRTDRSGGRYAHLGENPDARTAKSPWVADETGERPVQPTPQPNGE